MLTIRTLGLVAYRDALGVQEEADFETVCATLAATRPTAVNLFWAVRRMKERFAALSGLPIAELKQGMVAEAQRMYAEDIAANQAMGRHGATLMPDSGGVLGRNYAAQAQAVQRKYPRFCA